MAPDEPVQRAVHVPLLNPQSQLREIAERRAAERVPLSWRGRPTRGPGTDLRETPNEEAAKHPLGVDPD